MEFTEEVVEDFNPGGPNRLYTTKMEEEDLFDTEGSSPSDQIEQPSPQEEIQEQVESQQEKQKRRKTDSLRNRFNVATQKSKIQEAQLAQERAEKEHLMALLREKEELLSRKEAAANEYYENYLEAEEESLSNALEVAQEEMDPKRSVSIMNRLLEIKAKKETNKGFRALSQQINRNTHDNANVPYYQNNYAPQNQYQEETPQFSDAYINFLDANPWADPDLRDEGIYSEELVQEAVEIRSELEKKARFNRLPLSEDQTYQIISNVMRERHGVEDEYQEPQYNTRSPVSGVSRSGASKSEQYALKNPRAAQGSTQFTKEEIDMARSMARMGLVALDDGRQANEKEAIDMLRKLRESGKSNIAFRSWR